MRTFFNFLTTLSLRFRWLVIALSAAVMVLGGQAWSRMNQELLPPVEFPASFVFALAGGMNSTQALNLYTLPLEAEFANIGDIVNIESNTSPGIVFLNLANEFGVDRTNLNAQINAAIDRIWLPIRQLKPPAGESSTVFGARLLNDLDGATLRYLAAADPALLLELAPATWTVLSDEAIAAALPLFAAQTSSVEESATSLERFVVQQIVPNLLELEGVADVSFSGGESIARLQGETGESGDGDGVTSSLLLQLDAEAWEVIARKARISGNLNQALAESLAAENTDAPAIAPALPISWQTAEETRFRTADDLLEIVSFGNSLGSLLNDLANNGQLRGPLGQTDDLDAEIVARMLAIDSSFATAFDEEQLLALPADLFAELPEEIRQPEDARVRRLFALKDLGADLFGRQGEPAPADLPNSWRVTLPTILAFSLDDFPIAIFSISGAVELPSSEEPTSAPMPPPPREAIIGEEGPELPAIYPALSAAFGLELDTADDLLNIALPPELGAAFGITQLTAAEFLNTMAQLAGVDFANAPGAGEDVELDLGALFSAIAACSVKNQLSPSQTAALTTAGTGVLITCIDAETLTWLTGADPTFIPNLTSDVYAQLPDSLLELDLPGFAPPLGGSSWETLFTDYADSAVTTDALTLFAETPAAALNAIAAHVAEADYDVVVTRLLDDLSPLALRTLALRDKEFLATLTAEIWRGLSRESLTTLLPKLTENTLTTDLQVELQAIVDGAPTALESWRAANADAEAIIAEGPPINVEWEVLANFYGIELDTADDFIRFQDVLGSPAAFMNSLFLSQRGLSIAPGIFGNFSYAALAYLTAADEGFLPDLSSKALRLLSAPVLTQLESLAPSVTERSEKVDVSPRASITRANLQPSLLLSLLKTSDANSVQSYHAIEAELSKIQAEYPFLVIDVVSEQASFIEESISGVAREGTLGAVFTIVIILLFLSDGRWPRSPRRVAGFIMFFLFSLGLAAVTLGNLGAADGDLLEAFNQSDIVLRVLLIVGALASLVVLILPGELPLPAWRSTLVTTISIPLSLMAALAMLHYLPGFVHHLLGPLGSGPIISFILKLFPRDVTLNIMVLSGLTVAIGRVVDDSIVVLENIFRQMQLAKMTKHEAILTGTRDVSAAIFTATIVAVVVFLPLGLTGGLISEFFLPFGIAVTYALLASFIVAIVVVPVLASLFIREEDIIGEEVGPIAGAVMKVYVPFLRWSLARWRNVGFVIVGALISMMIGFALFGMRPFAFLPSLGEPQISVTVQLPGDTSILETNEKVARLESFIRENDGWEETGPTETSEVREILSEVGSVGGNASLLDTGNVSENSANLTLTLRSQESLERWIEILREEAGMIFAGDSAEEDTVVNIDHCDPALAQGTEASPTSGGDSTSIIVSAASALAEVGGFEMILSGNSAQLQRLNACVIQTLSGIEGLVNISSNIATGEVGAAERATYIRINRRTALLFSGELETENSIGVTAQAIQEIESLPLLLAINADLPPDDQISASQGFNSEVQTEGFISVGRSMVLALILVIVILIFTFGSPVYWLVIIFSVIVAPVGAAIALTVTNRVLGISALIGLLMLIGIVITNAVVLIDRVQTNRRQRGMETREALLEAGERRLRPILMTSLATIIALLPLAIGLSEGAIVASEMGTVVIGGVLGSTILTLIVVPVAYMLFNPAHVFFARRFNFRRPKQN